MVIIMSGRSPIEYLSPCSFENLDKKQMKARPYIDVWPHQVTFEAEFDNTFMLVLQLACVLHMKGDWKSSTKIRIFIVLESKSCFTSCVGSKDLTLSLCMCLNRFVYVTLPKHLSVMCVCVRAFVWVGGWCVVGRGVGGWVGGWVGV